MVILSCSLARPTVSEILARSGSGLQEFDRMDKCAHKTPPLNGTPRYTHIYYVSVKHFKCV